MKKIFITMIVVLIAAAANAQTEVDTRFYDTFKDKKAVFGCKYQAAAISINNEVERWGEPVETPFIPVRLDLKSHSLQLGTTQIAWGKLIPDEYNEAVGVYETDREGVVLLQFDWNEEQNILFILVHEDGLNVCKLYYCQYVGTDDELNGYESTK
ncbi:MAG: hypothetical protein SNI70_12710 [Rikenellaceae bacterium]